MTQRTQQREGQSSPKTIGAILVLLACLGCSEMKPRQNFLMGKNEYYPLTVGSRWVYVPVPHSPGARGALDTRFVQTIDTLVLIDGGQFARIVNIEYHGNDLTYQWVEFLRYGQDGELEKFVRPPQGDTMVPRILPEFPSNGTSVWFTTAAKIGTSWVSYGRDETGVSSLAKFRITLESKSDTVKAVNQVFVNCLRFLVDQIDADDVDYQVWLAKGVGPVKYYVSGGIGVPMLLADYEIVKSL